MDDQSATDLSDLVGRRIALLEALVGPPREKRAIVEACDRSRSTIDRAVRELSDAGLVERRDGGYAATTTGAIAADAYRAMLDDLDAVARAQPILDRLPPSESPPPAALSGAEVALAEPPEPRRVYDPMFDLLSSARRYCGLSASVGEPRTGEAIRDQAVAPGNSSEFVIDAAVVDHLRRESGELLRSAMVEGGMVVHEHPSVPFGLGIGYTPSGPEVIVVAYADSGDAVGTLVGDDPAAVAWAEDRFLAYRRAATELEPPS